MVFPNRAFFHSVDLRAAETGETTKVIWTSSESTNHRRPETWRPKSGVCHRVKLQNSLIICPKHNDSLAILTVG